jgi:predicted DNA-binding transcriptional regulator AlpA
MDASAPQYLNLKQLLQRVPFGKTKLYEDIQRGEFPPPVKFGRMSRWLLHQVEAWERSKWERRR